MISVVNVSPDDAPNTGINQYEVRINNKLIASFEHDRQYNALPQCLRDAADAVEQQEKLDKDKLLEVIFNRVNQIKN